MAEVLNKRAKLKDRRLIKRFAMKLPILIKGIDIQRIPFEEATTTLDISSKGAYFMLKREINEESKLQAIVSLTRSIRSQALIKKCAVLRVENINYDHGSKKGIALQFNSKAEELS